MLIQIIVARSGMVTEAGCEVIATRSGSNMTFEIMCLEKTTTTGFANESEIVK